MSKQVGNFFNFVAFSEYLNFMQNSNENIVKISALKFFVAFLGLPGSFFGVPVGFLINGITY